MQSKKKMESTNHLDMKKLPIRKKLQMSYRSISILSTIALVLGMIVLIITNMEYRHVVEGYGNSQGVIGKLGMEFNKQQSLIRDVVSLTGSEQTDANKQFLASVKDSSDLLTEVGKTISGSEQKKIYSELTNNVLEYRKVRENVTNLALQESNDEALRVLTNDGTAVSEKVAKILMTY